MKIKQNENQASRSNWLSLRYNSISCWSCRANFLSWLFLSCSFKFWSWPHNCKLYEAFHAVTFDFHFSRHLFLFVAPFYFTPPFWIVFHSLIHEPLILVHQGFYDFLLLFHLLVEFTTSPLIFPNSWDGFTIFFLLNLHGMNIGKECLHVPKIGNLHRESRPIHISSP